MSRTHMAQWDQTERRTRPERRKQERRRSIRYTAENLVVLDGVTWLDSEGTDRRHKVRRKSDREKIAKKILDGYFD